MTIARTSSCSTTLKILSQVKISHSLGRIQQIAIRALSELAIALALTAICIPFVATWAMVVEMLGACLAMAALNMAILVAAKRFFNKEKETSSNTLCNSNFYHFGAINTMSLIHETGHFCAAKLLFKGRHQIQIIPFIGGCTKWSTRQLTSIGLRLGYRHSILLITLAGTALALLAAGVMLIAGLTLRHSYPQASSCLAAIGLFPFLHHAEYALSALWSSPTDLGHDFVRLKTFGIQPIAAVIAILSIPTILVLRTVLNRNRAQKNPVQDSSIRRN